MYTIIVYIYTNIHGEKTIRNGYLCEGVGITKKLFCNVVELGEEGGNGYFTVCSVCQKIGDNRGAS